MLKTLRHVFAPTALYRGEGVCGGVALHRVGGGAWDERLLPSSVASDDGAPGALVVDGRRARSPAALAVFGVVQRRQLAKTGGRLVLVGDARRARSGDCEAAMFAEGLEGFARSAAKELGPSGATATYLRVARDADGAAASPSLRFLLSGRSAYVSGASFEAGAAPVAAVAGEAWPTGDSALARPVDAVVHNAGVTRDRTLFRMGDDEWDACLDVNALAPRRLTAALDLAEDASVVLLGSTSGVAGNAGQANYAAAKSALFGWAAAATTYRVNAVAPGFIASAMTAKMPFANRFVGARFNNLGRPGTPEDVANVIAHLASPASGAIRGQVLRCCGGFLQGR
ncbi:3-oxoacyl-[acyl-carrier-protein] reductase [Aureococcus anophagefferens]|nr:3-oxoacyl-[acyl-carrier-protein] reductase [Aureococcus anophagefferens]